MTTFARPQPHRLLAADDVIATATAGTGSSTATSTAGTGTVGSPALGRYVTDGLLATIEAYRSGTLPLPRFAWELTARIDNLAELDPPALILTRLRWLHRGVELLHAGSAGRARSGGLDRLTEDEENSLTVTLAGLCATLAAVSPDGRMDLTASGAQPAIVVATWKSAASASPRPAPTALPVPPRPWAQKCLPADASTIARASDAASTAPVTETAYSR